MCPALSPLFRTATNRRRELDEGIKSVVVDRLQLQCQDDKV